VNIGALPEIIRAGGVVNSLCYGPVQNRAAVVVVYPLHILRENNPVVTIDFNGKVCPPHDRLRKGRSVVNLDLCLEIGFARLNRNACHPLHSVKGVHLAHPDGFFAVFIFFYRRLEGHVCRGAVMLRPVELYSTGNPGTRKPDHRGFYYLIMINKIISGCFIKRSLHLAAYFGKHLKPYILVFKYRRIVFNIGFFVADIGCKGQRIKLSGSPLIRLLLKKHRQLFRLARFVCGNNKPFKFCLYFIILHFQYFPS